MMNPSTHRIRRQRWLVKASSQQAAFAIRQQLRSGLDTVLLPVFERAFDALGADEEVVHIPRLSLELKLRPDEDFLSALEQALREELGEYLHAPANIHERTGWQRTSIAGSRRQALLHYLATGRIEWHAAAESTSDLAPMLRAAAAAYAAETTVPVDVIDGPLPQRYTIAFRLLQLLPTAARASLLQRTPLHTNEPLPPELPAASSTAALLPAMLGRLAASGTVGSYLQLRVQALLLALHEPDLHFPLAPDILALLHECMAQMPVHAAHAGLYAALLRYAQPTHTGWHTLPASLRADKAAAYGVATRPSGRHADHSLPAAVPSGPAATPSPSTPKAMPARAAETADASPGDVELPQAKPGKKWATRKTAADSSVPSPNKRRTNSATVDPVPAQQRPPFPATSRLPPPSASTTGMAPAFSSQRTSSGTADATATSASAAGWAADHAGLVLLHPFLPRLFEAVGITTKGEPGLPDAMLPRAAAMLHWLASGEEEIYEFELAAIKVLLGLAPDDTLLVGAGLLDEAERAEADALLSAAISHWTALGQTSLAGFRHSFLQRHGLLRSGEREWQLQLEAKPYDVLLKKLPWSISIVRLPWMTKPIFTDWPTQ